MKRSPQLFSGLVWQRCSSFSDGETFSLNGRLASGQDGGRSDILRRVRSQEKWADHQHLFSLLLRISHPGTSSSARTVDLWECFTPAGGAASGQRGLWRSLLSETWKKEHFSFCCESYGVDHDFPLYLSSKTAKPQSLRNEFLQVLKREAEFCFLKMSLNSNQVQKQQNYDMVSHVSTFILKGLKGYEQKGQR